MNLQHVNLFRSLHSNSEPLILVNIWDAASAAIVQNSGGAALATSSASLAWANGYPDGSKLPQNILLNAIAQILRVSRIPLTVDIEDGYSDSPDEVVNLVSALVELGIAGINIEDGGGAPNLLIEKISKIRTKLREQSPFINARTDVYLRGLVDPEKRLGESVERLQRYIDAGADGVFVPGLICAKEIAAISTSIKAPLNVMALSASGELGSLADSGACRISLGPASFIDAYTSLLETSNNVAKNGENTMITYDSLNSLLN